jgi:polyhydroxybutyrate depolymerase
MRTARALGSLACAAIAAICATVEGCSGSTGTNPEEAGAAVAGGSPGSAGAPSSTKTADFGGASGAGGTTNATGGTTRTGGASGSGGTVSSSGTSSSTVTAATGGNIDGGTGGRSSAAGATGIGGATATGGNIGRGTGGRSSAAGATGIGGATATGGDASYGGSATGTKVATGGVAGVGGRNAGATSGTIGAGGKTAGGGSAQCPNTSTLKTGDNRATLQLGGRSRSYGVYVPSSVKSGTAAPLIFDFHGHGSNSADEESSSGWKKKADQVGAVMVYPDGVDSSWNVGNCCGLAMSENVDDVGFTRAMLEAVSKAACIDAKRVYATGMSNGAGFTQRLACEAADVIAAIAAASADLVTDPCTPARPISELSLRGLTDTLVAYAGGNTGSTGWYSPGAKATLDLWKKIDQCTGSVTTTHQYCESYTSCAAGVEITLCSLPNTGHDTYNNAVGLSVPDVAWELFLRQPMP